MWSRAVRARRFRNNLPSYDYFGRLMPSTAANGWGCPYAEEGPRQEDQNADDGGAWFDVCASGEEMGTGNAGKEEAPLGARRAGDGGERVADHVHERAGADGSLGARASSLEADKQAEAGSGGEGVRGREEWRVDEDDTRSEDMWVKEGRRQVAGIS